MTFTVLLYCYLVYDFHSFGSTAILKVHNFYYFCPSAIPKVINFSEFVGIVHAGLSPQGVFNTLALSKCALERPCFSKICIHKDRAYEALKAPIRVGFLTDFFDKSELKIIWLRNTLLKIHFYKFCTHKSHRF